MICLALAGLLLLAGCGPDIGRYPVRDGAAQRTIELEGCCETVGEVLAGGGIALGAEDRVLPPLDAPASEDTTIVIDRASEVQVLSAAGEARYRTQQDTLGAFIEEAGLALAASDRLLADGRPLAREAWADAPLPARIAIDSYKTVTVREGEAAQTLRLAGGTVADALREAEIVLGGYDRVSPLPETPVDAGMVIEVVRAAPFVVAADEETIEVRAESGLVSDIVAAAGVALGPLDYTRPAADAAIRPGERVEVVRVTEVVEAQDEPLPYETVYQADASLPLDTVAVVSGGTPGTLRRETRVRYENGVEAGRETSEFVAAAPVNEVIAYGTQIAVRTMDTPEGPVEYWRVVTMQVAAYTPRSAGKQPGEPGYGITASGLPAGKGVVAVDPSVVPFRSQVYVPGYGVAIAGDTGGGVKGRIIDLGYDDDESYVPWRGTVDVYYLTPVPAPDKIRYILP
jgi:uncharacterized protein YabE (DUF348 family)